MLGLILGGHFSSFSGSMTTSPASGDGEAHGQKTRPWIPGFRVIRRLVASTGHPASP